MSISEIAGTGFNFALLNNPAIKNKSSGTGDVMSSLAIRIAESQSQIFGSLLSSFFSADAASKPASIGDLLASQYSQSASTDPLGDSGGGISASGRNTALFDPESAYGMMSVINNKDVAYKAQFSELSQMKSYVTEMRQEGQKLGHIDMATDNGVIKAELGNFAGEYNDWVRRFDEDMQNGGAMAGVQAAEISRWELEQSVGNMFNGARDGLHGLRDLGFTIDPVTKLAVVDTVKLDAVLAGNKQGVVDTVQEFSANFARAAELLNADGNFIPRQLDNLSHAIAYIDDNKSALQAEFGLGDAARPTGRIAQALAAYNQTAAISRR